MQSINTLFPSALDGAQNAPARREFHYQMTKQCAFVHLLTCYREEVEARGGVFQETDSTLTAIRATAEWLTDTSRRPWLVLGGGVGTGKTTLLLAVKHLAAKAQNACRHGSESASWRGDAELARFYRAGIYLHRKPWITPAQQLADWAAEQEAAAIFESATNEKFLAIDDLGTEPAAVKIYGTEKLPLVELLAARYDLKLPTIITTNLGPEGIADRYGERIADRLREIADAIGFEGNSFRGR